GREERRGGVGGGVGGSKGEPATGGCRTAWWGGRRSSGAGVFSEQPPAREAPARPRGRGEPWSPTARTPPVATAGLGSASVPGRTSPLTLLSAATSRNMAQGKLQSSFRPPD